MNRRVNKYSQWLALLGLLVAVGLFAVGCSDGGSSDPPPTDNPPTDDDPPPADNAGLDARPENTSCIAPASPAAPPDAVALEDVFPDLPNVSNPVAMVQVPGVDDYFYVAERAGRVRRFANAADTSELDLLLDISAKVDSLSSEGGLLGMAFHPDAASNRVVYLSYTTGSTVGNGTDRSVIARFTLAADFSSIDPDSEQVVLELPQPAGNHNGGDIAFGPDGYLYIGFGDGGAQPDQSQDTSNYYGAMLRIDVDPTTDTAPFYSIPPDNPLVGEAGAAEEIFAYGFRNPWRWSFDSQTGELWLADVGSQTYEEINQVSAGHNYGWPIMEGMHCRYGSCDTSGLTLPVAEYEHESGRCSITGGYVYRGDLLPGLDGHYLFGDYCTGEIWSYEDGSSGAIQPQLDSFSNIAAFAQDHAGEVYVLPLQSSARLRQLRPDGSGGSSNIASQLSATGCFDATDPAQPAAGLIPFDVISPLWSDGATKQRYLALPNGETIDLDAEGDFDLPVGTVLAKHFSHNATLIETRLFMHHETGWAGYSYEWNSAQSDATLLDGAKDTNVAGLDWHFPSGAECMQCHTSVKDFALAPERRQLNRDFTYPTTGRTANQIETFDAIGLFTATPDPALDDARLFALNDDDATLLSRVKSYLHVNCSQCHQPGGSGGGAMDLRFTTELAAMNICDVPPADDMGVSGARMIAPASPSQSVVLLRMESLDGDRMPPLASQYVDDEAVMVLTDWINSLVSCP